MPEIHNFEYVLASYTIAVGALGGYIALLWTRINKTKSRTEELNGDKP